MVQRRESSFHLFYIDGWAVYSSTIFKLKLPFSSEWKCHHCHFPHYRPIYVVGCFDLVPWLRNLFLGKCRTLLITGISFKTYNLFMQVFYLLVVFFKNVLTAMRCWLFHFGHSLWVLICVF